MIPLEQRTTDIHINSNDLKWCLDLGLKRSGSMGHMETPNSKDMMKGSTYGNVPPWFRHYLGAIGEKAYSIMTGFPVNDITIGRGDSGIDFPDGYQVKCSGLTKIDKATGERVLPNLLFLVDQWDRKHVLAKNFCLMWAYHLSDKDAWVRPMGHISIEDVLIFRKLVDFGHGPTWFVNQYHLTPY